MPHAVDTSDLQALQDDEQVNALLRGEENPQSGFLSSLFSRPLDLGEKAEDAQDYEDISDDDLPDEEDAITDHVNGDGIPVTVKQEPSAGDFEAELRDGLADDVYDDYELFGAPSSPQRDLFDSPDPDITSSLELSGAKENGISTQTQRSSGPTFREVQYGESTQENEAEDEDEDMEDADPKWAEQQRLFAEAASGYAREPPPPETNAELFETVWPNYDPEGIPHFTELFPQKRAFYPEKAPLKAPKAVQPSKVNLELLADQERTFRLPGPATSHRAAKKAEAEQRGVVWVTDIDGNQQESDDDMGLEDLDPEETIGGVTVKDLAILCEDWDVHSDGTAVASWDIDEWDEFADAPASKRRKIFQNGFAQDMPIFQEHFPSLDDPESTASTFAHRIILDQNDPHMLMDIQQPDITQKQNQTVGPEIRREVSGSVAKNLARRFNVSNDEAYDLLKQNHSHKVRSTLSNIAVEHSLPALKLQYPFYKVKLSAREARSAHRPTILFKPNQVLVFSKLTSVKRKLLKGMSIQSIFSDSHKLSLGDNSDLALFEYSEQYPTVLSNFGMGNRLVNYYRRKDEEDASRPKLDLGETQVLLPQDKSPFSIFGNIEPGDIQPTLHNSMFRAPVFKHDVRSTDFLIGRSATGVNGDRWFIRAIPNLFVVGQEFPSVEVPGTHSRKVTEAAKKRLKMISYRLYRKNAGVKRPALSNEMIRAHLPGTDIAQNRGKMREFMAYDKENGSWVPKRGDVIPEELTMRGWIKPEDICLLDSTQVGHRHLLDAGYDKDEDEVEVEVDDEEEKGSLEQQLAPWNTTKNFLNACQGKAMLQLHGEGDPSGRGEAFSFIKTSMKGGFKAIGESVADKLDAKRLKELGGHSYNVARQQRLYEEGIKRIWEAQKASLSSIVEHADVGDDDNEGRNQSDGPPDRLNGSITGSRLDEDQDEIGLQSGKVLQITRQTVDKYGKLKTEVDIIKDPRVINMYIKKKREANLAGME